MTNVTELYRDPEIVVVVTVELPDGSFHEMTRREPVGTDPRVDVRVRAATLATAAVEVIRAGLGVNR